MPAGTVRGRDPRPAGPGPAAGSGVAAPSGATPDALVVAQFPSPAAPADACGASIAASLAIHGLAVTTAAVSGTGGDAHENFDFATVVGLRAARHALAGRRFDLVVVDPGVLHFRQPRRLVHLTVMAEQLRLLLALVRCGRRLVRLRRAPTGFRPMRDLAATLLRICSRGEIDPAARFAQRHAALTALRPAGAAGAAPAIDPGRLEAVLAGIGGGGWPRHLASEIALAAGRAGPATFEPVPARSAATVTPATGSRVADPVAVAETADPAWSAGAVRVTRMMVHMRAALGAMPRLKPGTLQSARRLAAWYRGPMQRLAGRGMPVLVAGAEGRNPSEQDARIARRLAAWWSDLALNGELSAPIARASAPDPDRVEVLARALDEVAAAVKADRPPPPLPDDLRAVLARRVAPGETALSGLEFAFGLMGGITARSAETGAGWRAVEARRLVARLAADAPWLAPFTTPAAAGQEPELSLVGFARNQTGLSENLAMTAGALRRAGLAPVTRSIELGLARVGEQAGAGTRRLSAPVRLIHVNADLVPQVLVQPVMRADPGAINVGFLLWELDALPEAHRLALDMLDEAWCPTEFVADAYRATGRLPVHRIGKAVMLGPVEEVGRAGLGLPEGDFLFLVTFDFHSSVERKNPLAAVRAFQRAFPRGQRGVGLVIKTTEPVRGHWGDPNDQWRAIRETARHDPRIRIVKGMMPRARYMSLIAAADCLVSPHRAEGFGYAPAQAMLLGRPSIVTDWSGTRDFCTEETSYPVPAELVPVKPRETILPVEGARWAAIDEVALAETMRRVAEDRADAARRADAGKALMRRDYSVEAQAGRYLDRLRALGVLVEEA